MGCCLLEAEASIAGKLVKLVARAENDSGGGGVGPVEACVRG